MAVAERAKSSKPRDGKSGGKARKTQAQPAAAKLRGDKPSRKADSVSRDLLRRITKGELKLGAVLPKEAELATDYGVNRGVIREAIKLLEVHRLVEPVRRRGTIVLDPLRSMSPEVLLVLLVPRPGDVDLAVLSGFLEVRAKLDADMTAAAASRCGKDDVDKLRAKVNRLSTLIDEPREYIASVHELTLTLARSTRNPVYEMLAAFNSRVTAELEQSLVTTRPPSAEHVEGLRILIELVAAGDVDGARQAVVGFHRWAIPRIMASAALASGKPLASVMADFNQS